MLYYEVKKEFDNAPVLQFKNNKCYKIGIWIDSELYTQKELDKMKSDGVIIPYSYFNIVNISKRKIYWLFGARFKLE